MQALHMPGGLHTHPAGVGSTGVSTGVALRQRVQQRLRLVQVRGVKALGEPMVDWREQVIGFLAFALLLPEARQAGGSTEFPGFRLLILGYTDGLMEAGFCVSLLV